MEKPMLYYFQDFKNLIGVDRLEIIDKCFKDGFNASVSLITLGLEIDPNVEFEMRTKANIAHDYIKGKIKSIFANDSFIRIDKVRGIFALIVDDKAFCRVKKFIKETSEVSVYPTQQQKDFNNQVALDGIPERATYITLGYHHDAVWSEIFGVYASCYVGDELIWFSKIGGEGFSQIDMFQQPPANPIDSGTFTQLPGEKTWVRSKRKNVLATGTENKK